MSDQRKDDLVALAASKQPRTLDDVIAKSSPEVKEMKAVFDADYQARMHCCPHGIPKIAFTSGKHSQPYKPDCTQCSVEEAMFDAHHNRINNDFVRLHLADTGEVKEWHGRGVEDGHEWRESPLRLALNLVEDLTEAIERARTRGERVVVQVRFYR